MLLEKMWAKLHGCYDRIAGGREYEAVRDLTGAPGIFYFGIDDETFDMIYEGQNLGYIMFASVSDNYTAQMAKQEGIVRGHAYTIL